MSDTGKKEMKKTFQETSWPEWRQKDLAGLGEVLASGSFGHGGKKAERFCERFAKYNNVKHALLCANGTISLELILRALEIGRGDEVILPPYTFIASISSLVYAGVKPVFADIDPETYILSPESVVSKITPRTKAVLPVYVGGGLCDFSKFEKIAEKYGLYIIGDGAQAVGSEWEHVPVGKFGIAASFSCQNSKNLTCGEGGIITTDDDRLYERMTRILNGGKNSDGRYETVGLGNGMSEWQASLLDSQLDLLDEQIARRTENTKYLNSMLTEFPFIGPLKEDIRITRHTRHLHFLKIHEEALMGASRDQFLAKVNEEGLPLSDGYRPLYYFGCLKGDTIRQSTGGEINTSPDTPVAEHIATHEASWLHQVILNGSRDSMEAVAEMLWSAYRKLCGAETEIKAV